MTQANVKRVVIEYEFKGYTQPDDPEALLVDCTVTYSDRAMAREGLSLAGAREQLGEAGFERLPDVAPIQTHEARRLHPRWREVWAKEERKTAPAEYVHLSPEGREAKRDSAARARGYWPGLARTGDKAIVERPLSGGRRWQGRFARGVARLLPDFHFNSQKNWWEADLAELPKAYKALGPDVCLSAGAREYLEVWA